MPLTSLDSRVLALVLDPRVVLLIVVVQTDELLNGQWVIDAVTEVYEIDRDVRMLPDLEKPLAPPALKALSDRLKALKPS